jgi:hypothetical protein
VGVTNVRKGRKIPQMQWLFCNKEGYNDSSHVDKEKEKGSMRVGCKAHVKVKLDPKVGCWYYDAIDLDHNHQLHPKKRMTHFMHSHKNMEDGVKNLMEVMTRAGVQHQAQMNVMSELYEGWDKWTFTERDMRNRYKPCYNVHIVRSVNSFFVVFELLHVTNCAIGVCTKAEFMREERSDDIPKLLEFFRRCKSANEYFFWDSQINE